MVSPLRLRVPFRQGGYFFHSSGCSRSWSGSWHVAGLPEVILREADSGEGRWEHEWVAGWVNGWMHGWVSGWVKSKWTVG